LSEPCFRAESEHRASEIRCCLCFVTVSRMPVCVSVALPIVVSHSRWCHVRRVADWPSTGRVCIAMEHGLRRHASTGVDGTRERYTDRWARPACMGGRRGALSGPVAFPTMFGCSPNRNQARGRGRARSPRSAAVRPSAARRSRATQRVFARGRHGAFRAACASSFSVLHPRRSWALRARPPGTSAERAGPAGPHRHLIATAHRDAGAGANATGAQSAVCLSVPERVLTPQTRRPLPAVASCA